MNLSACAMLPHTPENGVWHRLIPIGYLTTALSSAHTKVARSRFSAGSLLASTDEFAALYFADDPVVAQFEIGAVLADTLLTRAKTFLPLTSGSSCPGYST